MQISYFGLSSFKLTSKDKVAILDPFSKQTGLTPPRGAADVVILTEKANPIYSYTEGIQGQPFMVDGPGEYDVQDYAINGIPIVLKSEKRIQTLYLIRVEDIVILDLGHIEKLDLTEDELEDLGDIDILLVPVGGNGAMDAATAAKTVNLLEPRIVIPMHYKTTGLETPADDEAKFIKQLGGKAESLEKLTIKKKEILPDAATRVIQLQPLR